MRLVVVSIGRLKQGPEQELAERYRERFEDIGRKLGFRGVVFTDDVDMKAIANHFALEDVARSCLEAGVDAFLCCQDVEVAHRMIDGVVAAVKSGAIAESRLAEAARRMQELTDRWAKPPLETFDLSVLACDAHRAVMDRIVNRKK